MITHWAWDKAGIDVPLFVKNPLEGSIWFNYPGQTQPWGIDINSSQPSVIARVLDDGSTQISYANYNGNGNLTSSVDSLGRSTSVGYAANGIDLTTIQQQTTTGNDLLASFTNNAQHLPTCAIVTGVTNWLGYSAKGPCAG